MIKLFILFLLCLSMNAFAGQECQFELSFSDEPEVTIASETIKASDKDFKSFKVEKFFVESELSNKNLALDVVMNGWSGEEEATIGVLRNSKSLTEKVSFRGNYQDTLWFEEYKLDIKCSLA